MTLMEFSMFPVDKGESLSPYVARLLEVIDGSGLEYRLTPMGTVVEGEWDELVRLLTACFRRLESDCRRVSIQVKFDHRAGDASRLQQKIDSVEQQLGRSLKK